MSNDILSDFEPSAEYIAETFDNGIANGTLCLSDMSDSDNDFIGMYTNQSFVDVDITDSF